MWCLLLPVSLSIFEEVKSMATAIFTIQPFYKYSMKFGFAFWLNSLKTRDPPILPKLPTSWCSLPWLHNRLSTVDVKEPYRRSSLLSEYTENLIGAFTSPSHSRRKLTVISSKAGWIPYLLSLSRIFCTYPFCSSSAPCSLSTTKYGQSGACRQQFTKY